MQKTGIYSILQHAPWHFHLVCTFSICLQKRNGHLLLGYLKVSHSSNGVIDRTGVELPGPRNTVLVSGVRVTDCATSTNHIWASVILSNKLLGGKKINFWLKYILLSYARRSSLIFHFKNFSALFARNRVKKENT